MKNYSGAGVAILVLCLLGWAGVSRSEAPLAAQTQKQANNGWASVDCDREHSGALQRAIDRADPGQTILVSGSCYENVSIPPGKDLLSSIFLFLPALLFYSFNF